MRQLMTRLALCAGLALFGSPALAGEKVWISLGDAALGLLKKHSASSQPAASAKALLPPQQLGTNQIAAAEENIHLIEVDMDLLGALSHSVHEELRRCGGYMYHASKAAGLATLKRHSEPALRPALASTVPSYVIDRQATVTPLLSQMQASNIGQTIVDLSGFTNRYYTSNAGVNASNWLKQRWTTLAAGRPHISVTQFNHPNWPQKSVIATIQGSDNAAEHVVMGAHLDSIHKAGTNESTIAPGADDDASGVASLSEVLRVLAASNYQPRRTIKLMAYAAEEVGLRGSQEIARSFAASNTNVVGVLQLDMTNYKGATNDIYIFTDYTDAGQNQFLTRLIQTYLPSLRIGTDRCGYACSDHASWTAQGYAASMPFEASFSASNPHIHTSNDTYANSGNQAEHALKFSRMALAYAVELGSDGPGVPPVDKTETFSGSLSLNQTRSFGPFKAAAGSSFKASTTGSGDIDLYARRGATPSTSLYDCKSDGPSAAETCTLSITANGDVYVLLKGYSAGSYQLTVTYRPQ